MDKEKQIKSNNWLTEDYSKEELARIKDKAIEEAEAELRDKQIEEMATVINEMDERNAHYYDKYMQECEAFADANNIAKSLYNAGYRKASDIAEEIFAELEKAGIFAYRYPIIAELKKKYTEEEKCPDTKKP